MTLLPDQYLPASLVNGKPTCTFAPAPFHRTITNIVVGNTVQGGVKVYRASLSSVPAAQNPLGINNTLSGSIRLPAGQILFVQWDNVGAGGAKDAFARVSFVDASDNPLADSPDTQAWALDLVTILVLPTGATTGARIVLDATTDMIQIFDAANHLVAQIDPSGFTGGDDLTNMLTANYVRMNVTDALSSNPAFQLQPGVSFAGNWQAGQFNTTLISGTGTPAEIQTMTIDSPDANPATGNGSEISLRGPAHDNSFNGQINMFADTYHIDDVNGDILLGCDVPVLGGDFLINNGGLQVREATNFLGGNQRMGMATLVAGTVTVNNNTITSSTRIFLTCQTPHGTPGFLRVSARVANTSFTILSSNAADTSDVAYILIEGQP